MGREELSPCIVLQSRYRQVVSTHVHLHFLADLDSEEGNKRGKAYQKIKEI